MFIIFSSYRNLYFGLNASSAAPSNTIYVSTTGNNTWDGLSLTYNSTTESGPKLTINNATGTVTINGTVYIETGTYNATSVNITNNMTITGESQVNTIINGTNTGNIFYIPSGMNIYINNLTILNGKNGISGDGGAIYNQGTLSVTNTTFNNNTVTNEGGAIYNSATLNLTNITFNNNTAIYNGGAIYNIGNLTNINSTIHSEQCRE